MHWLSTEVGLPSYELADFSVDMCVPPSVKDVCVEEVATVYCGVCVDTSAVVIVQVAASSLRVDVVASGMTVVVAVRGVIEVAASSLRVDVVASGMTAVISVCGLIEVAASSLRVDVASGIVTVAVSVSGLIVVVTAFSFTGLFAPIPYKNKKIAHVWNCLLREFFSKKIQDFFHQQKPFVHDV